MRLRFSLRTLLVLTALAAAACYWWVARPTAAAERFVRAVDSKQFAIADRVFRNAGEAFLSDYQTRYTSGSRNCDICWHVELKPREWRDVLAGRRKVMLNAAYAVDGMGHSVAWEIKVTPLGLTVKESVTGYYW